MKVQVHSKVSYIATNCNCHQHLPLAPCLQALLSQAGFPAEASADQHITVSRGQWEEFVQQFRGVLQLLQQIANVWNLQEPCIISGFDMDRVGTIQALSNEPAGTFICRFSMSQPGCLVLTCKTVPGHACSDKDNLLHAIIKVRAGSVLRNIAACSIVCSASCIL